MQHCCLVWMTVDWRRRRWIQTWSNDFIFNRRIVWNSIILSVFVVSWSTELISDIGAKINWTFFGRWKKSCLSRELSSGEVSLKSRILHKNSVSCLLPKWSSFKRVLKKHSADKIVFLKIFCLIDKYLAAAGVSIIKSLMCTAIASGIALSKICNCYWVDWMFAARNCDSIWANNNLTLPLKIGMVDRFILLEICSKNTGYYGKESEFRCQTCRGNTGWYSKILRQRNTNKPLVV